MAIVASIKGNGGGTAYTDQVLCINFRCWVDGRIEPRASAKTGVLVQAFYGAASFGKIRETDLDADAMGVITDLGQAVFGS